MSKVFFPAIFLVLAAIWMSSCGGRDCRIPQGRWTNREGQVFIFDPEGQGLWLTRFGSAYDTVGMNYRLDCGAEPMHIDMDSFRGAMYEGKQLYGIMEWSSDTSFRILYEIGTNTSDRPLTFESDLTQKFYKE